MERDNPLSKKGPIDTKDESTEYCAIPGGRGRYKWPTLAELHDKLFEVALKKPTTQRPMWMQPPAHFWNWCASG
jgi:hypothetical protein